MSSLGGIDPMVSLALAVYSNKGAYALLLGSGISRASGIPTGWEVVLDLIRKVAKLHGQDCEPNPAEWFSKARGLDPDYSKVLHDLAKTSAERQQLLRGYFEPNELEQEEGLKSPTAAHKAIAALVGAGYIRVIITTNFDRLIENAIEAVGIVPTVISTTDQIKGALPLALSRVTIIKLHGDYLDTRIKNTDAELAAYDKPLNKLLDRILDEYGLIVSGWSGEWDSALRAAIERCPSRRFTTYWTTVSALGERAKALVARRSAIVIQVKDANELFVSLKEKVNSLEDLGAPHPLTPKLASATVKRYIVDTSAKVRFHDLVHQETEKLLQETTSIDFDGTCRLNPTEELIKRVGKYEALSETLLSITVTGCFWGREGDVKIWIKLLTRIANPPDPGGGKIFLLMLRRYPALLLFYGAGIASIAAGNYHTFADIVTKPKARTEKGKDVPICSELFPWKVMEDGTARSLPGFENQHTPLSNKLFGFLRGVFTEYLPRDEDYEHAFDRFEYLLALVHADLNRQEFNGWWGPVGRFGWKGIRHSQERTIVNMINTELTLEHAEWPPLKAGLFGGSVAQAETAIAKFAEFCRQIRF